MKGSRRRTMPNQRAGLFIPQLFKPSCRTASNHRPGPPPDGRQAINGTDHSALHVKSCRISLCGTCHSRQMVNGAELLFECNNWGVAWKRSAGLRSLRATPSRFLLAPRAPRGHRPTSGLVSPRRNRTSSGSTICKPDAAGNFSPHARAPLPFSPESYYRRVQRHRALARNRAPIISHELNDQDVSEHL